MIWDGMTKLQKTARPLSVAIFREGCKIKKKAIHPVVPGNAGPCAPDFLVVVALQNGAARF
jgi:hypothetical protein